MFYTIYKVTNIINNKIYIGKHQTLNPNDSYLGSGVALKKSISKHGKENFRKEVLFIFDSEQEMNLKEKELITEEFVARPDTYNLGVGGEGGAHFKGKKHTAETLARIRNTQSDPVYRINHPGVNKGKRLSDETKLKISKSMQAKFPPKKPKTKASKLPRVLSEETKEKIRLKGIQRWIRWRESKSERSSMVDAADS